MRGELIGVKDQIIDGIFVPLIDFIDEIDAEADDEDLWVDLLREAIPEPRPPFEPTYSAFNEQGEIYLPGDLAAYEAHQRALEVHQHNLEAYTDAATDEDSAWAFIVSFFQSDATTERELVQVIEDAFDPLQDHGGDALSNEYFRLVGHFIEKYSLRYDLRRPSHKQGFTLHPTLAGIFTSLINELKRFAHEDQNLAERLQDFEEALRDLKTEQSSRRIRICIQAQMNLLEAIGCLHPEGANSASLGEMCKAINSFPHTAVGMALSNLYGFSSDFAGVRHGKKSRGVKREVEMRDLVSISIALAGFVPYLTDSLNSDTIYSG
ncbi:hypothetical protein [Roseibium aggregatum]|uniref:hypothetical protein n=1 Tax=Roseibium aggregatum TaxID=187304 RepID=UPI001E4FEC66|nr:hypothetical protein [Roseibium aggregatum]UES49912.1 hypothetical protein GFK88_09960 [Roseibium aggregatum]